MELYKVYFGSMNGCYYNDTLPLKVKTDLPSYERDGLVIDIYVYGYYDDNGVFRDVITNEEIPIVYTPTPGFGAYKLKKVISVLDWQTAGYNITSANNFRENYEASLKKMKEYYEERERKYRDDHSDNLGPLSENIPEREALAQQTIAEEQQRITAILGNHDKRTRGKNSSN